MLQKQAQTTTSRFFQITYFVVKCRISFPLTNFHSTNYCHIELVFLLDQWQAALGWFCCLSLMASLVGFAYLLKETPTYPSLPHAVYQGLHRLVWALTVTWIILACEEGYGGMKTNRVFIQT